MGWDGPTRGLSQSFPKLRVQGFGFLGVRDSNNEEMLLFGASRRGTHYVRKPQFQPVSLHAHLSHAPEAQNSAGALFNYTIPSVNGGVKPVAFFEDFRPASLMPRCGSGMKVALKR